MPRVFLHQSAPCFMRGVVMTFHSPPKNNAPFIAKNVTRTQSSQRVCLDIIKAFQVITANQPGRLPLGNPRNDHTRPSAAAPRFYEINRFFLMKQTHLAYITTTMADKKTLSKVPASRLAFGRSKFWRLRLEKQERCRNDVHESRISRGTVIFMTLFVGTVLLHIRTTKFPPILCMGDYHRIDNSRNHACGLCHEIAGHWIYRRVHFAVRPATRLVVRLA
jgi:hypothetical protein